MPLTIPTFLLARATISLYPADAQGNPIRANPIWAGARQEGLTIPREIEELRDTPTGSSYDYYAQLGEIGEISIDRVWCQDKSALSDYDFSRGSYVMEIFDREPLSGVWVRWTAYGCQARRYEKRTQGITYFVSNQVWRVQRWKCETGKTGDSGEEIPAVSDSFEQPLLFTHDDALALNDYFIGCYQFPIDVRIGFTKVIAQAAGSPNVITLEVNGILTAHTLTIPGGAGEVNASATFNADVTANQTIRWKATSGTGATMAGVTMLVKEG